ncbi:membrane protein insertase YidC [Tunicatimonas pelagia]|uniref:membrane protein insertase YidC n=1 Tax=Tunicatimonas pelagia TaxID=931531 RepID=UPI0026656652|nr:membrane protein insertase YidC [Tunicatimonas pelagia]WKN43609.1 membrane protein insertase YidC [Tunicatimonas pelagia]
MDKNQAIGFALLALLLIVYFQFFAPEPVPVTESETVQEKTATANPQSLTESELPTATPDSLPDSVQSAANRQRFGAFAAAATGEERIFTLENENMRVRFSTQGGRPVQVQMKNYEAYGGGTVDLLSPETSEIRLVAPTAQGEIDLYELFYSSSARDKQVATDDTTTVEFVANLENGRKIRQTYRLAGQGYELFYNISVENASGIIQDETLTFIWNDELRVVEKDGKESRTRGSVKYFTSDLDDFSLLQTPGETETELIEEPVVWLAMKQRFFTSGIIADQTFPKALVTLKAPPEASDIVQTIGLQVPTPLNNGNFSFKYYFGPNDQRVMETVAVDFEDNIDWGYFIVKPISKYVISPLFHFLERFSSNYGLIIVIVVLILKTALFPLTYKSYISMAKMKVLKPELDELKEKHGDDMAAVQKEQMQLYQKVGVNPISGCIPMVLQMPILLSMFFFFPNSIELRQEPFLWTDDLSTYDAIVSWDAQIPLLSEFYGNHVSLFVLLMTLSQLLITWSNSQATSVQGPMKSVQYVMPVMFMFILNQFPAALSFYYLVSNFVTFGQQVVIRRFVDDDKIRQKLEENKKKNRNKKKSKFQLKLEEAMKATEENKRNKPGNRGAAPRKR